MISTIINKLPVLFKSFFIIGHPRSIKVKKNIIASFGLKGLSLVIGFLLVPLTLNYIDVTRYGIWLTLSSIIGWFGFFDIGLGNGLRNKFAEAIAKDQKELARTYVSTTYFILLIIVGIVYLLFLIIDPFLNWTKILNTPAEMGSELGKLVIIVFTFFCIRFVFKLIGTILVADQKPAINNGFNVIGSFLSLVTIYILTKTTSGSLLYLGTTLSAVPVIVLLIASLIFYNRDYNYYKPSFKYVDFKHFKDLAGLGRSAVTIKDYTSNLKLFNEWYQKEYSVRRVDFTMVKGIDMLSYRSYLQYEKRHKTATINQHIAALRSFFSFLHNKGFIVESVIADLKPLSKPYVRAPDVPKRAQILKLFRMVNTNSDRGRRDFAILQLFVQCGLRLSEVANVELGDIDMDERKGVLRIAGGKGDQPREVSLNKTARHALKAYLGVRANISDTKKLFISQLRRPLSSRSVYHLTKKYLEMAGMPDLSCHDLRHFFATNLYNRHKDILLVKAALGHRTLESTLRYSHKTGEEIASAMEDSDLNIYRSG